MSMSRLTMQPQALRWGESFLFETSTPNVSAIT